MEKVGAKKLYGARTDDQTKLGIDVLLKVYRWNNFLNHPMSAFEQAQNDSFAAGVVGERMAARNPWAPSGFQPSGGGTTLGRACQPHTPRCWQGLKARKNADPTPCG